MKREEGTQRYDAAIDAVRRETEAGLGDAELRAVRDSVVRRMRGRRVSRGWRWPWLVPLLTAAAAAVVMLLLWPRVLERAPEPAPVRLVVRSGEVKIAGAGESAAAREGARVELPAGARAHLDAGEVAFMVTRHSRETEPFRVQVGRDEVLVYEAQFAVFAEEARVERVTVTVGVVELKLEGESSSRTLRAGEAFERPAESVAVERSPDPARPPRRQQPSANPRAVPAGASWDAAMTSLRAERCDALRAQVADLVKSSKFAEDKAQALLLDAECAVRKSDKQGAVELYEKVAREYPWTASAETAVFEMATLQGDITSAEAYLQRYPQGRFADAATFRRCELLLRSSAGAEARACLEGYRRDFPSGMKIEAVADYLRRLSEATR
ncbi:MAG: hypothetical protein ACAI38_21675 [Myxococcota bacterium]